MERNYLLSKVVELKEIEIIKRNFDRKSIFFIELLRNLIISELISFNYSNFFQS